MLIGVAGADRTLLPFRRELEHDVEPAVDAHVGQRDAAVAFRDAFEEQIDTGVADAQPADRESTEVPGKRGPPDTSPVFRTSTAC